MRPEQVRAGAPSVTGPLPQRTADRSGPAPSPPAEAGDPGAGATTNASGGASHHAAGGSRGAGAGVEAAWTAYVAAARQLDGVRRGAAAAATEQARAVQAAREELTAVRERLAPQRSRLHELGVPPMALVPTPPELTEAARAMVGGPTAVLATLGAARGWADVADDVLTARRRLHPGSWPPRARNLLVYGPLALVVPLLQVALHAAFGTGPASVAALLCGLPMPAVAFVAGWWGVGRLFGGNSRAGVDGPARPVPPPGFGVGGATGTGSPPNTGGPTEASGPANASGAPEADGAVGGAPEAGGGAGPGSSAAASGARPDGSAAAGGAGVGGSVAASGAGVGGAAGEPVPGVEGPEGRAASSAGTPDQVAPVLAAPAGWLDRTPRWGALVCLVPAVLATTGILLSMLAG
ncbi:hypothetical protein [Micromonospora sp. NPDC048830]|uniref:hypothetical protein n=1 Tax=Micromonospora sp. NPDC048830 TaxID=3364257 RepID=UPI003720F9E2